MFLCGSEIKQLKLWSRPFFAVSVQGWACSFCSTTILEAVETKNTQVDMLGAAFSHKRIQEPCPELVVLIGRASENGLISLLISLNINVRWYVYMIVYEVIKSVNIKLYVRGRITKSGLAQPWIIQKPSPPSPIAGTKFRSYTITSAQLFGVLVTYKAMSPCKPVAKGP